MQIVEPSATLITEFDGEKVMKFIERCGRVCYRSENKTTADSAEKFVRMIIKRGHESVLEHFSCTFEIIADRGVMAELTRHRVCSFSIESSRFVDYNNDDLKFIQPDDVNFSIWSNAMIRAEDSYKLLRQDGSPPEQARDVLPMSLATKIIMTANLREWRHILKLRTSSKAHPKMRQIANMILEIFKGKLPVVFEDIGDADD